MPGQDPRSTPLRPAATPARQLVDLADRLGARPGRRRSAARRARSPASPTTRRRVLPGDLYAALPGSHTHGARFADRGRGGRRRRRADRSRPGGRSSRRRRGRVAGPRGRRPAGRSSATSRRGSMANRRSSCESLGVTGTNGKTTTSYLIDAGLRAAGEKTGLVGTIETSIGELLARARAPRPRPPICRRCSR